ncbi:MAG TPA: cytochrome b N-terminal domain-containing protein [Candidatus Limnocylindrales bacterium]
MSDSAQPIDEATPPQMDLDKTVAPRAGWLSRTLDQFGFRDVVTGYLIPVETNSVWYSLGGVLAISLVLEILTGFLLALLYVPDASRAFDITQNFLASPGWSAILSFHFYNAFLIFVLIMIHMVRVFISGGYRGAKTGLWLVGVGLAGLTFALSLTGEALHWDEVGFGVPWNIGEFLNAIGLAGVFNYGTDGLTNIATATEKLAQLYAVHIAIVPVVLGGFIIWHYLLIRLKGISTPFWMSISGRTDSFSRHIRSWLLYSFILIGAIVVISVAFPRSAGTAPQLIPSSPLFGVDDDPGGLGFQPNFPISWTRGMNIVAAALGIDPDIWGTVIAMAVMLGVLLLIPFLDRGLRAPLSRSEAFDWRKRGLAFAAMIIFWLILLVGLFENAVTGVG